MKIKKTIFLAFCFALMNVTVLMANPELPEPPQSAARNASARSAAKPPPPPGVAIDQNLFFLAGFAVLFGIYAIRRYDFIKKASI